MNPYTPPGVAAPSSDTREVLIQNRRLCRQHLWLGLSGTFVPIFFGFMTDGFHVNPTLLVFAVDGGLCRKFSLSRLFILLLASILVVLDVAVLVYEHMPITAWDFLPVRDSPFIALHGIIAITAGLIGGNNVKVFFRMSNRKLEEELDGKTAEEKTDK